MQLPVKIVQGFYCENDLQGDEFSSEFSLSVCMCVWEREWRIMHGAYVNRIYVNTHQRRHFDTLCFDRFRRATEDYYACPCSTWTSRAENIQSEADWVPFRGFEFLILSVLLISSMSHSLLSHSFTLLY